MERDLSLQGKKLQKKNGKRLIERKVDAQILHNISWRNNNNNYYMGLTTGYNLHRSLVLTCLCTYLGQLYRRIQRINYPYWEYETHRHPN